MATTVIVSAGMTLGTLRYAHRRASPETDRNFFKAMGIIVGLIAFSTALGPMLAFRKHCTRSHTSALNMQDGWGPGQKSNAIDATSDRIPPRPGYICMAFAVLLKATSVVAHLALRAPGNPAEESVARRLAWISMD